VKYLSIRWQMTLWYGISLAVILFGFCLLLFLLMRQQVFSRVDANLHEEVKEIVVEIDLSDSALTFRTAAEARFSDHSFYKFLVTDQQGKVVFASLDPSLLNEFQNVAAMKAPSLEFTTRKLSSKGPYRIAHSVASSQFGELNVRVMVSLKPIYADLYSLQWMMACMLPLGVLLALAIGQVLAGQALAPVQRVVDIANSINISCLDRRVEVINSHDEIGKLAAALNSLISRLEQAVIEIRRFTADASHEIRTPIAVLRAEAESTLRAFRTPEEYERVLHSVVEQTTRLGKLTDQLLNLSRYDAGIIPVACEPVQIDALLQDVADHLLPLAATSGITLTCEIQLPCEVLGDDIRISQAFFNVIENAIKYTPQNGAVKIHLSVINHAAVIEVKDSGIGIPLEDLPHIFERFYRVDPSRQSVDGGMGLGLSIAKAAIEAHQGTITLQSQSGKGTTVTIALPAGTEGPVNIQIPGDGVSISQPELSTHEIKFSHQSIK
jgi:heavy metal sensor kinase